VPVLSANMDTITEDAMVIAMGNSGGNGVLHRANTITQQVTMVKTLQSAHRYAIAAIGINGDYRERAEALLQAGAVILVLDTAHGHSMKMKNAIQSIQAQFPYTELIVGNVATYDGARFLADLGVSAIKIGIGPGSVCTTRQDTGAGVPQLQAIREAYHATRGYTTKIIADGGMKTDKDIFFSLLFGADTVMLGKMLSGLVESANPHLYRGMASEDVQRKMETYKGAPEGKIRTFWDEPHQLMTYTDRELVPVSTVMRRIKGHLLSSLSYAGVTSLQQLHEELTPHVENFLTILSPRSADESFKR